MISCKFTEQKVIAGGWNDIELYENLTKGMWYKDGNESVRIRSKLNRIGLWGELNWIVLSGFSFGSGITRRLGTHTIDPFWILFLVFKNIKNNQNIGKIDKIWSGPWSDPIYTDMFFDPIWSSLTQPEWVGYPRGTDLCQTAIPHVALLQTML